MAKQLNIFMENKPGRLKSVTEVLFEKSINIRAMTIQDRGDFGLMKLLVDNPKVACLALTDKGFACALKDALAIVIDDKLGGLYKLSDIFLKHNINVVDAYGFVVESSKYAVWCVEAKGYSIIRDVIKKEGFKVLEDEELYEL